MIYPRQRHPSRARVHFLSSGVLSEEELGNKLFVHEISNEYAAHIPNLRSFDAVSRDVLQRWAYPFVPDTNVLQPRTGHWGIPAYSYARGHVYCEKVGFYAFWGNV